MATTRHRHSTPSSPTVRRFLAVDVETNALRLSDPRYAVKTVQLGSPSAAVILSADDAVHRAAARRMMVEEAGTGMVPHCSQRELRHASPREDRRVLRPRRGVEPHGAHPVLASMIEPPMLGNDAPPSARAYRGLKHQAATWCPSTARSEDASPPSRSCSPARSGRGWRPFDVYKTTHRAERMGTSRSRRCHDDRIRRR